MNSLNALLEHHLALERAVDGTFGGDHAESLDLLVGEVVGQAQDQLELGRAAAFGGAVLDSAPRRGRCPSPCAAAYISIVIAVHDARLAASSSWGSGAESSPPACHDLIDDDLVIAHLDGVPETGAVPPCRRGILESPRASAISIPLIFPLP